MHISMRFSMKLCFAHKSLVQAWRIVIFWQKHSLADGLPVYKVKIANKTNRFLLMYLIVNFLCIFCLFS